MTNLRESIGTAAARHKGMRMLFEELGLDYYREGNLSIEDASCAAGLDLAQVRARIEQLSPETGPAWPDRSLAELIEHLEKEHHAVARDLIAHTALLFAEACRTGCDTRLTTLRSVFRRMSEQLLAHMEHEELVLFPAILALEEAWTKGEQPPPRVEGGLRGVTGKVVLEHVEISRRLDELRKVREAPGNGGQMSPSALLERLVALERHLHEYMNLENYVVFPRAIALEDALYQSSPATMPG